MAYGSADSGFGAGASVFHLDASHADTVFIADADLLFNGAFKRHGPDLVLTGHDGDRHVVPGYFSSEHHPALVAPNGARLSADLVDLLAGSPAPNEYAQAASTAPAGPIGKVEKVAGHVVIFRNGVEVAVNVGDAVYKGDVIQTGVNSACGVDFPDGTALNLVANTRMALSEFSFDPNGHSNDALFSLVQGTFAFVAGKVAHTGDMKIETPVATMGIRGTTGFVQEQVATISANAGNVTYSFAVVEDYATNRVGSYELVDDNPSSPTYGQVIATVSQNGFLTFVTPQGPNLPPIVTTEPMNNSQLGFEQQIIDQLFAILNSGTAPQSTPAAPGSSTPPDDLPHLLQLLQNDFGNTYTFNVANGGYGQTPVSATINGGGTPPNNPGPGQQNSSNIFIWTAGNGTWTTPTWSQPGIPNAPADTVEVLSGPLFYDANYTIGSLYVAPGVIFDIVGGSLTVLGATDDEGTILVTGDPPALKIDGPLTVGIAGHLRVSGTGDVVDIANSADNLGVIAATDHGKIVFKQSNLTNEGTGKVKADDHGTIVFKGGGVDNAGIIEAKDHGSITFKSIGDGFSGNPIDVTNSITDLNNVTTGGTIKATDGGTIKFLGDEDAGSVDNNYGVMEAARHGTLVFNDIAVANSNGGTIEAKDGGTIIIKGGDPTAPALTDGGGTIAAIGRGSTVDIVDHATINGYVEMGSNFVPESGVVGTLEAAGGTLFVSCDSNLFGPINVDISNGGLAHFADVINQNAAVTVAFCGPGTLQLDQAPSTDESAASVTLSNFWVGDVLDLTNLRYSTRETVTYTDGVLTVVDGCSSESFTLACGNYSSRDFVLVEDATGGTEVVLADFAVRSGDWDTVCNWSNGVPNAADTAVIDAHVTVCVDEREGIENLIVGACATLDIGNCGSLVVANALDDSGRIEVGGSHSFGDAQLKVDGPVHLTRTGEIVADGGHSVVEFSDDTVDNSGRLEAEDHGRVKFDHTFVTNDGGTIAAFGCDAKVELADSFIGGGTLKTDNGGVIETVYGCSTLDGVTIGCNSYLLVNNCTTLTLSGGTTMDGGTLCIGCHGTVDIETCQGATLDGVTVWNSGNIEVGESGRATLTLADGTTIHDGTLCIGCHGTVDIETCQGATLDGVTVWNSGNIEVGESGRATLTLADGTTIHDGTLCIGCSGTVDITTCQGATLDGVAVWNSGDIQVGNWRPATLTLAGDTSIGGDGTFAVGGGSTVSADEDTAVSIAAASIDNCGTIEASNSAALTLTTSYSLSNYGTIDASGSGSRVNFSANADGNTVQNGGIIEATNHATIDFEHSRGQPALTVDNNGGTIEAIGNGATVALHHVTVDNTDGGNNDGVIKATDTSTVELFNGTDIIGGTISAFGSGVIEITNTDGHTANVTFDGSTQSLTINGAGDVQVDDNDSLTLRGTIDNHSAIDLGMTSGAILTIDGTVNLDDQGVVNMVAGDTIVGVSSGGTLNNHNTIAGAGTIGNDGDGNLTLTNDANGTIDATGGTLTIDTGNTITNNGLLEATNGGTLDIQDAKINNTGTGVGGIFIDGTSKLLVDTSTLKLTGSGDVTLETGSIIDGHGAADGLYTLENVNNTISGAGTIGEGSDLALTNDDNGIIDATGTLTIDTGNNAITNTGTLEATGLTGDLIVASAVTGTGSVTIGNGAVVEFESTVSLHQTVTFSGGGYGELIIDDAAGFSGKIAGFTGTVTAGAPSLATTDEIDVTNVNYDDGFSEHYNSMTGVLKISDGTNTAKLTFTDFSGTFQFTSDGSGGTLIYDPPATNSSTPSASQGNDSFVFHTGANGGNTGALWVADTNDHADWAHTHQEWSQLAGDVNSAAATDIAQHAESHWHYALHSAAHLH